MKLLWGEYETESDVYGWLFFDLGWLEETSLRVEDAGTIAFFTCGLSILVLPLLGRSLSAKSSRWNQLLFGLQILCLPWIALWQGAHSLLHAWRGGSFMAEWAVAAHAVRIFTPLALIAFLVAKRDAKPIDGLVVMGDWILRLAVAATFITHGVEAIRLNPAFVDLLIGSANNLLGWAMSQSTATIMLYVIGVIDIALAVALLARRWRSVAGYLAFWGIVTACSRVTAAGLVGFAAAYPETLIRAANGGAPLALLILYFGLAAQRRAVAQPILPAEPEGLSHAS